MTDKFKPYAAAHVFFVKDDSILLARRFNTGWSDGTYSVPAGHVEDGETITQAAIREAKEEVGVEILPDNISIIHVSYRNNQDARIYVDFFLICKKWEGELRNCEPDKCDDISWFKISDLPTNTTPYIRDAITEFQQNHPFSEVGWIS